MIYKLVTRVIQYFCFPDRPMKGGGHLGFLERGNLRKGGMTPRTNYESICKMNAEENLIAF